MELRGCSHLHLISVIRGAEVVKVPNITRERKVLKFKSIFEDIYASCDLDCDSSSFEKPKKANRSLATSDGSDNVNTEVKAEPMEEHIELDYGRITLKQLQKACRTKKRKASTSVKLMTVKQEEAELQLLEQDELELKETLNSWKCKLFKKKAKKGMTKCSSKSSKAKDTFVSTNNIASDHWPAIQGTERAEPVTIKFECVEFDCPESEAMTSCNMSNVSGNKRTAMPEVSDPYPAEGDGDRTLGGPHGSYLDDAKPSDSSSMLPVPDSIVSSHCGLSQASGEHLQNFQFQEPEISEGHVDEDVGTASGNQESDNLCRKLCQSFVQPPPISIEAPSCSLNQVSYEYIQFHNSHITESSDISLWRQPSAFLGSHMSILEDPTKSDESQATVLLELECDDGSCSQDKNPHMSYEQQNPTCKDNSATTQASCSIAANDFENVEVLNFCVPSLSTDDSTEMKVDVMQTPVSNCGSTLFIRSAGTIPAAEDKQSPILSDTVAPLVQCHAQTDEITDEVIESTVSEGCDVEKVQLLPERLFIARKTITPSSQERLCRAMNSSELQYDAELQSFDARLLSERRSSSKVDVKRSRIIFKSKGSGAVTGAQFAMKPRQTIRKGKDTKKGSYCKGSAKVSPASRGSPRTASGCSSVEDRLQHAIDFSQQQMHDFERLAIKLVTELHTMKEVVVDSWHSQTRPGAKLRYNTNEVRVAVENVSKVEETTKKWIYMMSRDCNRFCKIMKLAEKDAASPEKPVHKERKIMFADEAGRSLCDVKVFEACETSLDATALVVPNLNKEEP